MFLRGRVLRGIIEVSMAKSVCHLRAIIQQRMNQDVHHIEDGHDDSRDCSNDGHNYISARRKDLSAWPSKGWEGPNSLHGADDCIDAASDCGNYRSLFHLSAQGVFMRKRSIDKKRTMLI